MLARSKFLSPLGPEASREYVRLTGGALPRMMQYRPSVALRNGQSHQANEKVEAGLVEEVASMLAETPRSERETDIARGGSARMLEVRDGQVV